MKNTLRFIALGCIVGGLTLLSCIILINPLPVHESHEDPTHQEFESNYQIDLQSDGYLILDRKGEVYHVPFGQLEVWFLEMNL